MFTTKKRTFNQHDNEKESFYKFSAPNFSNQSKLNENISTDVCIIGGGLTGISSALNLSNQGLSITILEANKVGSGASGRNGGQLGIGMRKDQFYLEKKFGIEKAKFFWKVGLDAVSNVVNLIKKYKIDCALRQGVLHVGNTKKDYKYFQDEIEHMQKNYNYNNYEYFDHNSIRDEVNSDRYFSGMLLKDSYHLNPLKLTYGLAEQCLANGINIYENSPADKIVDNQKEVIIHSGKNITFYSFRHTYITMRLKNGTPLAVVAANCNTSLKYIQEHYYHYRSDENISQLMKGREKFVKPARGDMSWVDAIETEDFG